MYTDEQSQMEDLRAIFEEARQDGWDFTEDMLYSFYFMDKDVEKLEAFGERLEEMGYDLIEIFELAEEDSDEPTGEYMLQMDKVEIHTMESLASRNVELSKLTADAGIEDYDGWEVGQLEFDDEEESEENDQPQSNAQTSQ